MDFLSLFPPGVAVQALPHWQRTRLFLQDEGPLQRWRAAAFYPGYRLRARMFRWLVRAYAATGAPGSRVSEAGDWPLGDFIAGALDRPGAMAVLVGTPGPAQKATVQFWDRSGRVIGFVKYGETPAAVRRIEREATVLTALPPGRGPRCLKCAAVGGGHAILLSPVSGSRVRPNLDPPMAVFDFLRNSRTDAPMDVADHPWPRSLDPAYQDAATRWLGLLSHRRWPAVVQHGDFQPGNLLRGPGGRIAAVDWEYGTAEGFPFLDLAFYVLQTAVLIYYWPPDTAFSFARNVLMREPWPGLSLSEAEAVVRLAALNVHCQFTRDGQPAETPLLEWHRHIWDVPLP